MMQTLGRMFGKGKKSGEDSHTMENREPEVSYSELDANDLDIGHAEVSPQAEKPMPKESPLTFTDVLAYLFVFFLLAGLISATIISTFEVANRLDFISQVDQELLKNQKVLVDLEKNHAKGETQQKSKTALLSEISTLEKFREAARVIIASGAIPLERDVFSFRDLIILKAKSIQGNSILTSIFHGDVAINKGKSLEHSPVIARLREMCIMIEDFTDVFFGLICNYSSNSLMAISLVFSSIIGSMVCYYRKEGGGPFLLRIIISGMVMGFIVYIIVKGGKDFFILEKDLEYTFSLNLYSACLIAVLAGTLADRVFRLFRSLIGVFSR